MTEPPSPQEDDTPGSIRRQDSESDRKRDRYSTWSIVLLLLIVAYQVASSAGYEFSWKRSLKLTRDPVSSSISSDALGTITEIDTTAKTLYLQDALTSQLPSSAVTAQPSRPKAATPAVKPQPLAVGLRKMAAKAVDLLRRNPDDPAIARRVILLRAESGSEPFDPIPATAHHPGLADPLQAYAHAEASSPRNAPGYRREVKLWSDLFSRRVTDPIEVNALARTIDRTSSLRWYTSLALHQLYLRAGDTVRAQAALKHAQNIAALSVGPITLLTLFVFACVLLGIIVLVGVISRRFEQPIPGQEIRGNETDLFGFFAVPLTPPLTNDERRLRPRDLMDAFVIFLIMLNVVAYVVRLAALSILRPHLKTLSPLEAEYANILITSIGYLGGGAAATLFLLARARAVGASLAAELGLNRAMLTANLGFGLVGWGIGLLLMGVVSLAAGYALRAAPAPSNPALPLLISAPDLFTRILLYSVVAFAAPFFEELFFRGALLNALLPRFGPAVSIGLTGLFFGLVHPVGIAQAFALATLGMVMAWAAYTRKSLVPSMTMHWLQNSFSYFTLYFTFLTITHR